MTNSYYPQGVYPQGGGPKAVMAKKESPVNKCEFTGYAKPRGNYPEIRVNELPNGGASIKFSLECREYTGSSDENGNPKCRTTYVPVSVWANKIISVAMLKSVVPGMKIHVVGRWSNQHYKDKNGQDRNFAECEAYVLDIQETPQMVSPQMPPYGQPYGYSQQPAPQGYAPQQPAAPQPQYDARQQPYYPQPQYSQTAPRQAYPDYAQQGGYVRQQGQSQAAPQQPSQTPGYYQPAQRPSGAPSPQPAGGAAADNDLPEGDINI